MLGTGDAGLHISVAISPPVNAGRSIGREISIRVCWAALSTLFFFIEDGDAIEELLRRYYRMRGS